MLVETLDFPYTLRRSKRARRVSINLTLEKGVELVCPERTSQRAALEFLVSHSAWVHKHKALWQRATTQELQPLPHEIYFQASEQRFLINYATNILAGDQARVKLLQRSDNSLVLYGAHDETKILKKLKEWVRTQASNYLRERLDYFSQHTGLIYTGMQCRWQRTCWGSCNAQGKISLNSKLMFVPQAALDYVVLHELAHTRHMNHSKSFWKLVARYMPDYAERKRLLRASANSATGWVQL